MEIWQSEGGALKRSGTTGTTGTPQQHTKSRPRQTLNSRQLQASFRTCRSCLIQSQKRGVLGRRARSTRHLIGPISQCGRRGRDPPSSSDGELRLPDSGPTSFSNTFHCDCASPRRVCESNTRKLGIGSSGCVLRPFHQVREWKWSGVRHRRRAVPNSDTKTSLLFGPVAAIAAAQRRNL